MHAARYECTGCLYRFVTPGHIIQLLFKFAEEYGHFPDVIEAPPEYLYTLTHSSLEREEVGRLDHVTNPSTGQTIEASATVGLGRPAFVHKGAPQTEPSSLMRRIEAGLELAVEPRPAGAPLPARDEWGSCEWSQDGRRWLQRSHPTT